MKNGRAVLFRIFKRHARLVRQVPTPRPGDPGRYSLTRLRVDRETSRERVRREREERCNAIQRLAHAGMSKTARARALGLNWQTVRK